MTVPGEEGFNRRRDDESIPVLLHRLGALEKRVDAGFAHLDQRLDALSFVRTDVWLEREATRTLELKQLAGEVADNRRLALWAIATVGATLLGAIIIAIVNTATT